MLSAKAIIKYNQFRKNTDKTLICHAPFVNLNFEQNGNITACCYNRRDVLGKYPKNTISDAWNGNAANSLRKYIAENKLESGCSVCNELLVAGNYAGTKSRMYDEYVNPQWVNLITRKSSIKNTLPKVFEFELSNTCNLECTMCSGYFSSTIRKNREKLTPLKMVYDASFVREVSTFIPTLTDMKFLGGEPFLIDIYYDIWEEVVRLNPAVKIHITTNATILNNRTKQLLEKLNVGIILSIDSLNKATYEKIRTGASFERVMDTLFYFKNLTDKKNTYLSIAACPMIDNWQDLPQLLSFCNHHNIYLHFNVVWSPEELSLMNLPAQELKKVIVFLEQNIPATSLFRRIEIKNKKVFRDLIETLKHWIEQKEDGINKQYITHAEMEKLVSNDFLHDATSYNETFRQILTGILHFSFNYDAIEMLEPLYPLDIHADLKSWLLFVKDLAGIDDFNNSFFDVLGYLNSKLYDNDYANDFTGKIAQIKELLKTSDKQEQLAYELTETSPKKQIEFIRNSKVDLISQTILARYL